MCRREDHILLVTRARSRWSLPGGTIRHTESPLEAARRDLAEETTLEVDGLSFLFLFGGLSKRHHVFLVDLPPGAEPRASNEIAHCHWLPPGRVASLITSVLPVASLSRSSVTKMSQARLRNPALTYYWWPVLIGNSEMLSRLLMAILLGSVIGFERERLNWAAGLRTHMLVCVGACLMMLVSAFGFADVLGSKDVVLDPSRVAAQVVSGIGFLGAGSILLRGEVVRGLTTAASLWSVAGVGLAVGGGIYTPAIGATVIILVILAGIKPLERRFISTRQQRSIQLSAQRGSVSFDTVHRALGSGSVRVKQFVVQQAEDDAELDDVQIALSRVSAGEFSAICTRLESMPGVRVLRHDA